MHVFLNIISVIGTFLSLFGIFYLIQRYTIGFIPLFKKQVSRVFSLGDIVFSVTSLSFIIIFIDILKPY